MANRASESYCSHGRHGHSENMASLKTVTVYIKCRFYSSGPQKKSSSPSAFLQQCQPEPFNFGGDFWLSMLSTWSCCTDPEHQTLLKSVAALREEQEQGAGNRRQAPRCTAYSEGPAECEGRGAAAGRRAHMHQCLPK